MTLNVLRNDAPVLTSPSLYTINEDSGTLTGRITAVDPEGQPVSIDLSGGPGAILGKGGNFELNPDGSFSFTPDPNFNGSYAVPIVISDGLNTVQRTITFVVTPVVDPPIAVNDQFNYTYTGGGGGLGRLTISLQD